MGTADLVPGVSGGTMALVLGVYERLVAALRAATSLEPWSLLARGRVRAAWRAAHAPFLFPLVLGIGIAVVTLARVIDLALASFAVPLYAGFAGLILAAITLLARRVVRWSMLPLTLLSSALLVTTWLLRSAPAQGSEHLAAVFFAGAIGISALVLPGISGALILVLLGQYGRIIGAIASLDLLTLLPFALGALVGVATIARLLDLLLRRALDATMATLLGVMLASLQRVWPWTLGDGYLVRNVPPPGAGGADGWLVAVIALMVGFAAVMLLERLARQRIVTSERR